MSSQKNLLQKEQSQSPLLIFFLVMAAVSGFATYIISEHSAWRQWMAILHALSSLCLTLVITPYTIAHFRRALGLRRPVVSLTGLGNVFVVIALIGTGMHIMIFGRQEMYLWVYQYHVAISIVLFIVLSLHLAGHALYSPKRRNDRDDSVFDTLNSNSYRPVIASLLICLLLPAAAAYLEQQTAYSFSDTAVVDNYAYSYGDHRFRPSQTETSNNAFVDPKQIGASLDCITCHEDVGDQWVSSTHRMAASDKTYVTNVSLLADNKGIESTRYCEGCHSPIALLTGELSPGGQHGGIEGTAANQEGVSCMGCHGIHKLVHLQGVASYEFKPETPYLFEGFDNPVLKSINHFSIRMMPEQHKKDLNPDLLKTPEYCASCHAQFMDKDMNNWGWVKMQDEYSAWLESPFSGRKENRFGHEEVKSCNSCHMPLVPSTDPSADQDGFVKSHHYTAANTVLPLLANDKAQLDRTIDFLQSNKMHISIKEPNQSKAIQNRHALDEKLRDSIETPVYLYINETIDLNVLVSNVGIGHNFPGGTTDINEAWIEFIVMDATGASVHSSGHIMEDNQVEPNAYFYRSLPVDKKGNHVWKHDLFNRIGEASKNIVKSGETDLVTYSIHVPAWAKSPLTISATLKYRKLNERYARWALKESYQKIPIVDMARDSILVPLKLQHEVN